MLLGRLCIFLFLNAGCGKTSFVAAMAAKLGFSVCVLNLSEKNLNDCTLNMV